MKIERAYNNKGPFIYKCLAGDTVRSIAEKFGMDMCDMIVLNRLSDDVSAGDELLIIKNRGEPYRVKAGDSYETICAKFGIKTGDFDKNHVRHNIYPGNIIYIEEEK